MFCPSSSSNLAQLPTSCLPCDICQKQSAPRRQRSCRASRQITNASRLQFSTGYEFRQESQACRASRGSNISGDTAVLEPRIDLQPDLVEQQLVEGNLGRAPAATLSSQGPSAATSHTNGAAISLANGAARTARHNGQHVQEVLTSKAMTDEGLVADVAAMRVAYQGAPGAYSEGAAVAAYPDCTPIPCEQFEVAFQALSQWMAERAVLPIENSLGGSIHSVYDLLLRYRLSIVGEVSIEVNHCLLVAPGVQKSDVRRVISHYQALAQVENYVRKMPGVTREAVDDTAGAAKLVAQEGWRDVAAVASRRAAELYGLDILDEGIQDDTANVTRFLILARDPLMVQPNSPIPHRTSIAFSMDEKPGQLFKALSCFAMRDIDLTKIESRPLKTNPIAFTPAGDRRFRYLFFIDAAANLADDNTQNALRHLQEMAGYLRVLGCYPAQKKRRPTP